MRSFLIFAVLFFLIVAYRHTPEGWHYLPLVGLAIWLGWHFTVRKKEE